jgi:hypothetical protein
MLFSRWGTVEFDGLWMCDRQQDGENYVAR